MFLYVGIRTYVLARAMACDCSEVDRDPFRSGKPSLGLKKLRIDIAGRREVCNVCLPQMFVVLIIGSRKNFVFLPRVGVARKARYSDRSCPYVCVCVCVCVCVSVLKTR